MVTRVPPEMGPWDGWIRVKYGVCEGWKTNHLQLDIVCEAVAGQQLKEKYSFISYHKGERSGRQSSVVICTVPHTHLQLGLLNSVACGIVQQTHDSADVEKRRMEENIYFNI